MYLWKQRSLAEPPRLDMDRFPRWFRIVLLAIGVAALASAAWAAYRFSIVETAKPSPSYQAIQSEIPTVTLCELLANPATYDLKIIRVQAILIVNNGYRSLYDPSCITMEPMVGVEPDPTLHYESSAGVEKKFYDLVRPESKTKEGSARMVMVGRFEGPNFSKDGRKSRFQHQLILMHIEKAEPVKSDATHSTQQ